jgi:hypothetical protein
MCVVALILGMLLANMLKSVCGCKTVEGNWRNVMCINNSNRDFDSGTRCQNRYQGPPYIENTDDYQSALSSCQSDSLCKLHSIGPHN